MTDMTDTPRQRLRKDRRQERIVAELRAQPTLRVSELATDLGVSTETIRRDLDELESRGLINRTYGGAVRPFGLEPTIAERHRMMVAEREAIATEAARYVNHSDVLMIGGGATTVHIGRRLAAEKRDLTIITNAFGVATVLAVNPTFTIFMCPGRYNAHEGLMAGAATVEYLAGFYANHAILGATGMTPEGPNEADADAAAVYRAMMGRSAETMIVADHTKFDQVSLALYFTWADVTRLVTDRVPTGPLRRSLDRARVHLAVNGPEPP
ncbi:DeoR/GlpR family DNA-binding transcription regulator [Azospirillum halopraeferens]|uniref:DeoR/GlpR family DNA-binding transcription regulator n=1 Tax=Azospirillum halopraeferens TaxID=34010 RepID=UPI0005549716|nr:DeoR/GlpR family DNA-binding transcription regulator [Azospirillum halopraeferens]